MLIETHAHLDDPKFAADFDQVLLRAQEARVEKIITIGTDLQSSKKTVELAEGYPQLWSAVGVHPLHAEGVDPSSLSLLEKLAHCKKVVALGEIGLDYHYLPEGKSEQEIQAYKQQQATLFEEQLRLAVKLGLNVVIHQRDSWEDTLAILTAFTGKLQAVFHCFGGTPQQAALLAEMGHLVSFTGIVTFKNATLVQETATSVSAEGYMVETDSPYLAPVPYRGQRAEPAHTRLVAQKIAELRSLSLEEVATATTATAERFFRW